MTEPFVQINESYFEIKKWKELCPELTVGFTTRSGGVSQNPYHSLNFGLHTADKNEDVIRNREILAEKLEFPLDNWVIAEQVHANHIVEVDATHSGLGTKDHSKAIRDTDGLITNESDLLCAAFYADCVPLFFFDPITRYIGIAHAGWKGTVQKIGAKMIQQFIDKGSKLESIHAAIGPSISKMRYEVDDYVLNHVDQDLREQVSTKVSEGKYLLDLPTLNEEILKKCGLNECQIEKTSYCTVDHSDLFYSYRRDAGNTGRMLGFIGFKR